MARKKKTVLPTEGAAFAFPLEDGRYSVCRVVLDRTSEPAKQWKGDAILVACSAWIGDTVPDVSDVSLRPILHLTHHLWNNDPELMWVSDPPPDNFMSIGSIEPTQEEKSMICQSFGGWAAITLQPLAQWRWDNDREAVLAADEIKGRGDSQRRQREQQKREQYLAEITLEGLREHQFFPQWVEYPPKKAIRASRQIMTDTVQQLLDIGLTASESKRMDILQDCIERFNAIDVEMDHFIETVEREEICKEFEAIAHACGLGAHEDLADDWREW